MEEFLIINLINSLFVNVDKRNWEGAKALFADKALLDYTSLGATEALEKTPQEIIDGWKSTLPGFQHTLHRITNHQVQINGEEAECFCYGTAGHYLLEENETEALWEVIGSYDFHLIRVNDVWKIDLMRLNFKWMEGNKDLPNSAEKKVSG